MIPRGKPDEQDLFIFTGSVIKSEGEYDIFYTAHNHHLSPVEVVERASSSDLTHWVKHPDERFGPNPDEFELNDFRDPFVFREGGHYAMLVVSRRRDSGVRAGLTAKYVSDDLRSWKYDGEFYAPKKYHAHECPDYFELGGEKFLVFSEYSDKRLTRYAAGGPGAWRSPADDAFDTPAYYAAKTFAAPDGKRYLFGWISTNSGDGTGWQWGGNLAVHEVYRHSDGDLAVREPESVAKAFDMGESRSFSLDGSAARDERPLLADAGQTFRLELEFDSDAREFDIVFNTDPAAESYYKYTITRDSAAFSATVNRSYTPEISRPLRRAKDGRRRVTLLVDGDACVLYVDGETACTSRCGNVRGRALSLAAFGGKAAGHWSIGALR